MTLSSNFRQWEAAVQRELAEKRAAQEKFTRSVIFQALMEIIFGSPVDKGTFRASHNVSFGEPDLSTTEKTGGGGSGQGSAEPGQLEAARAKLEAQGFLGQVIIAFITNNLIYAQAIEDGHSKQAPDPIYGTALINARARIAAGG